MLDYISKVQNYTKIAFGMCISSIGTACIVYYLIPLVLFAVYIMFISDMLKINPTEYSLPKEKIPGFIYFTLVGYLLIFYGSPLNFIYSISISKIIEYTIFSVLGTLFWSGLVLLVASQIRKGSFSSMHNLSCYFVVSSAVISLYLIFPNFYILSFWLPVAIFATVLILKFYCNYNDINNLDFVSKYSRTDNFWYHISWFCFVSWAFQIFSCFISLILFETPNLSAYNIIVIVTVGLWTMFLYLNICKAYFTLFFCESLDQCHSAKLQSSIFCPYNLALLCYVSFESAFVSPIFYILKRLVAVCKDFLIFVMLARFFRPGLLSLNILYYLRPFQNIAIRIFYKEPSMFCYTPSFFILNNLRYNKETYEHNRDNIKNKQELLNQSFGYFAYPHVLLLFFAPAFGLFYYVSAVLVNASLLSTSRFIFSSYSLIDWYKCILCLSPHTFVLIVTVFFIAYSFMESILALAYAENIKHREGDIEVLNCNDLSNGCSPKLSFLVH